MMDVLTGERRGLMTDTDLKTMRRKEETMANSEDKWSIGGHEFSSRFILGSENMIWIWIQAAVECAGAEMITLALRRVNTAGDGNILDYILEGGDAAAQYFGSEKCGGGGADRPAGQRGGMRDFGENRSHPGFQVSAAGQLRDGESHGNSGVGRVCGDALHVSGSECRQRSSECGRCGDHAAGVAYRLK